MINHTMIVSFDQPLPHTELDQYLADIERVMLETGLIDSVVTGGISRSPVRKPSRR